MGELSLAYVDLLKEKLNSGGAEIDYAIYDYFEDFEKFWSDPPAGAGNGSGNHRPEVAIAACNSNKHTLVIIWDSLPSEYGLAILGQHLTPLDWALAFSSRVSRMVSTNDWKEGWNFSIHIVDLTSNQFENAFAMQMAASICEAMPWVKLYAPLPRGRRAYETSFPIEELNAGGWPKADKLLGSSSGKIDRLDKLNQAWRAWVVQSKDHHDLNNLIGPQVIAEILLGPSAPYTKKNDLVRTMLMRLEWAGLLNRQGLNVDDWKATTFGQPTNVIVIDDQLELGWDRVLYSLLGIRSTTKQASSELQCLGENDQIKLFGATNPEYLLQQLFSISKDNSGEDLVFEPESYETRNSVTPTVPNSDTRPTALILDLYLFAGKSVDETEEWYKTVGKAAQLVAELDEEQLAWPSFTEKDQIEALAETGIANDGNLDTALSLLPRLCALRWPCIPIIVFSATERRGLISKLADYGNIFLSSPKPNVLAGNAGEKIAAFVDNWPREFRAAQGLLRVQKELMALQNTQLVNTASNILHSNKHTHIVVAFDETGNFLTDPKSAVGGVILITQGVDKAKAIKKSFELQESLRKKGVNFSSRRPYYCDSNEGGAKLEGVIVKKKKDSVGEALANFFKEEKTNWLSAFCLWIGQKNYAGKDEYKDRSFLHGLATCVELIACELLPTLVNKAFENEKLTLSWQFASKATSIDNIEYVHRFDFRPIITPKKDLVETIGGSGHAYSVVAQALSHRSQFLSIMKNTVNFRSRIIPYDDDGFGKPTPPRHWKCIKCKNNFPEDKPSLPEEYKPKCRDCKSELFAEYSVLSHLADSVINLNCFPSKDFVAEEKSWLLADNSSFEVEDGSLLNDFIHISRLIDKKRDKEAFNLAFRHGFFLENKIMKVGSFAKAPLERKVQLVLKEYAKTISGNEIVELGSTISVR